MSYLKITHYLGILLKEGQKWEFEDLLNGNVVLTPDQIKKSSRKKRLVLSVPTFILFFLLKTGIDKDCVGYSITALSIFIGLFSSLIITMYDRFLSIPLLDATATNHQRIEDKKVRNFIRQFTFVTGKNLLIATLMIALMSLTLVFPDYMSLNVFKLTFISSFQEVSWVTSLTFLNALLAVVVRILVLYLTIDFFLLLLYALGALFSFLKREYL